MASEFKPPKLTRKVLLPSPPFDIHQDSKQEASHAASGILEIAAHNSSRRLPALSPRYAQKPCQYRWPEIWKQ